MLHRLDGLKPFRSPILMKLKSLFVALSRAGKLLVLASVFESLALAIDQTVIGNLSVTGDTDLGGNTLSVGTRTDSSTTPGLNLLYGDATTPTIYFNATRSGASWLWQSNSSTPQLKLSGTNQLLLYDQATTPAVKITLDPVGTSTFTNSVVVGGAFNASTIAGVGTGITGITQAQIANLTADLLARPTFTGTNTFNGTNAFSNTSAASSAVSGAVQVAGGIGVGGTSYFGKGLWVQGGCELSGPLISFGTLIQAGNQGLGSTTAIEAVDASVTTAPGTYTTQDVRLLNLGGNIIKGAGHTIASAAGVVVPNISVGSNNSNLILGQGATPTGNFSLYNVSPYNNYFAGNIGIGTATPAQKLDVVGNAKISGSLTIGGVPVLTSTGNGSGLTNLNASAVTSGTITAARLPVVAVQTTATQTLSNKTLTGATLTGATVIGGASAGQQMLVDAMGNVGIGTNTPATKLEVKNSRIRVSSDSAGANIYGELFQNGEETVLRLQDPGPWGRVTVDLGAGTSYSFLQNPFGSNAFSGIVSNDMSRNFAIINSSTTMGIGLHTSGSSAASLFVDSMGRVGIGTMSPTANLHVVGSSFFTDSITLSGVSGSGNIFQNTNQGGTIGHYMFRDGCASESGPYSFGLRYTDTINTNPSLARISLITSGNESLVVSVGGNVGVGTTTPAEKLDVVGNAKISGTLTVAGQTVVTSNQLTSYVTTAQVTTAVAPYQLSAGSGASLTTLNASALTDGTLSADRIATASLPMTVLASDPLARANHTGTQAWSTLTATPTNVTGYGITDAVTKDSGGNVGIGTSAPTEKLEVSGNIKASGTVTATGVVTTKTSFRTPPAGDLAMGSFTAGTNPATQ